MWSTYIIKLLLSGVRYAYAANVIVGHSADGGALCCLIDGRHRAVLYDGFSRRTIGGQSADNPDFTVCIIRCVYRAELILGT